LQTKKITNFLALIIHPDDSGILKRQVRKTLIKGMNDSTMEVVLITYFLWLTIISFKVHDSHRYELPGTAATKYIYCQYTTAFLYDSITAGEILHCCKTYEF
jgi:hypothetical protein